MASSVHRRRSQSVKLLSFTSLFPNDVHPLHGLFVRERVAAMKELMDLRVVAPVPYFPAIPGLDTTPLSRYASYARVPKATTQGTLTIDYPRFITFPGLLKSYDGDFMYAGARRLVTKLFKSFRFQLIDAHWLFPDGYAAARLAADLRVPFAVTVRGDDISSFPQDPRKRPKLIATLAKADAVIGVCQALIDKAKELGAPPERCHVIPNGIDCETFRAVDVFEDFELADDFDWEESTGWRPASVWDCPSRGAFSFPLDICASEKAFICLLRRCSSFTCSA